MFDDIIKIIVKAALMAFMVLAIPIIIIVLMLFDSFVQFIHSLMR